ncbi:MAG: dTMP kinase [Patescibacteria group bacterium]
MDNKFIVIEGIDGSGKATQTELLIKALKNKNEEVEFISFPQYDEKSSALVEEYLSGKYGTAKEVGPKVASVFFACDRYDGSFKIKKWLNVGKFVIADRYTTSNMHQAGKIEDKKERWDFIDWLFDLEFNFFGIPKPDKIIYLKVTPEFAMKSLENKENKDIHETDLDHLKGAHKAYMQLADREDNVEIVEVTKNNEFLPPEEINKKILNLLK